MYKKLKSNQIKQGETYFMSFYSDMDTKIKVTITNKPDCPIKCMSDDDRIIVESSNEKYEFYRSNSFPYFLLTVVNNKKDRAIFYKEEKLC